MHGPEPSQREPERDWVLRRHLQGDEEEARSTFERNRTELEQALATALGAVVAVKAAATRCGEIECALTGCQPESERDRLLQPVRALVHRQLGALQALV